MQPADIPMRLGAFVEAYKQHGWTEPALRWIVFNEDANGLGESGAVVRVGRSVFIVPSKFFAWLQTRPARLSPQRPAQRKSA